MRVWSKGLGKIELIMDFSKYEVNVERGFYKRNNNRPRNLGFQDHYNRRGYSRSYYILPRVRALFSSF